MALASVIVKAVTKALTLVALDGPGFSASHSCDQALITLVALDGLGCSASYNPDPSLDTSSPRWPRQ